MQRKQALRAIRRLMKTATHVINGEVESPLRMIQYAAAPRTVGGPLGGIDVRSKLSREEFVHRYLSANRPVIIRDAMDNWPARHWTLDSFERDFGGNTVTIQSPEFEGTTVSTLRDFIASVRRYERTPLDELPPPSDLPYVRNVMATHGEDFTMAAFERLSSHWERPYFMPVSGYVFPAQILCSLPNHYPYPQYGIYLSPRGAATALHADGGLTNALLGQIRGEKKIFLFSPDQTPALPRYKQRPPAHLLRGEPPDFGGQTPLEITLRPGMMIFIPKFHWHEVYTLSASISITYNFVHASDVSLKWARDSRRFDADPTVFAG